jgi:hypothetical protein
MESDQEHTRNKTRTVDLALDYASGRGRATRAHGFHMLFPCPRLRMPRSRGSTGPLRQGIPSQ